MPPLDHATPIMIPPSIVPDNFTPRRFLQICCELAANNRRLAKKYHRRGWDALAREHFTNARRWQARRRQVRLQLRITDH